MSGEPGRSHKRVTGLAGSPGPGPHAIPRLVRGPAHGAGWALIIVFAMAAPDYCDLCDLPRTQCVHGLPTPAPTPETKSAPKPRKRAPARPRVSGTVEKPVSRRWTPPEVFKPLIVAVLQEAGGELDADELFLELEIVADDRLLPGDRETTPEGELRWQYAARRARLALINEGLMTKGTPGVWQLS